MKVSNKKSFLMIFNDISGTRKPKYVKWKSTEIFGLETKPKPENLLTDQPLISKHYLRLQKNNNFQTKILLFITFGVDHVRLRQRP